ncbi:hypothetical protein EHI8A_111710 [Entamoeba histolytica HM-1:IMSS-B]|uniref:Uncharacterized protein n=6 Tax=Entamoeba histolytica TaxID=5759 RepID=C4M037_ENTH1|nr:hypothetical protein EHI_021220 [Entamoeba histolytica HM-1:IMSS]EMD45980.1 Hypothetical protein EHI5A_035220 [Entamoeba histolytica KU27]EMH73104.1 hypothetical protein EHI8A_111710 [Entamoeba histolytica HM-1:IMSS-B]EMS12823.1 hypothetical protein KM1_155990 [Entamoeba histolytica HM-3:IMSS]ENY60775.1 hypothetical protein EHI7A_104920 [Entamoeba histolytica HM-1:IMSS-A]BAJ53822.1 cysteine protease binding protein family 9 [Entamoeba histolytica]|eukprot:XP_655360.1 hypothetical protein EHI_021220 [Entamoeba histolytica HM-1:IMSS]
MLLKWGFLILFIFLKHEVKGQLCDKTIEIDIKKDYEDSNNLTWSTTQYPWSCRNGNLTGNRNGILYSFTTDNTPTLLKISTCYPHTNFPAIVRIFSSCNKILSGCGQSQNDDPEGVCGGILSRITFQPETNKKYYILITSTSNVTGLYTLTVHPYSPNLIKQNNCFYQLALNLNIPSVVDDRITEDCTISDIPNTDLSISGRWYSFTPKSTSIRIDTCNKYTSFPTTIYLFKYDQKLINLQYIGSNSNGCGTLASYDAQDLIPNELYYIVVSPTGGVLKQQRSFQLHIYDESQYGDCSTAFGITQFPFYMNFNISTNPEVSYTRNNGKNVTGKVIFFSLAGDTNKYVFTTFYTKYFSEVTETIIGYNNYCGNFKEGTFQGKHEYTIVQSEYNTNTMLQVICIKEPCEISVSVLSVTGVTNGQCENAHIVSLNENESYSQFVGSSLLPSSIIGCSQDIEEMQGSWYHFIQNSEDIITIGITPYLAEEFMCYLEVHDKCNSTLCLETSYSTIDIKYKEFYVFATSYTIYMPAQYGYFLFWALKSKENIGKYPSNPIIIESIPFTKMVALPFEIENYCSEKENTKTYHYGVWLRYSHDPSFKYTASTCGTESNLLTNITLLSDLTGPESLECIQGTSSSCGFGHSVDISIDQNVNSYIGIISTNLGVTRFSLYYDQKATDSSCKFASIISESRNIRGFTSRGTTSESKCREIISLKGIWYLLDLSQPANVTIQINASSSFKTAVEIYESCEVIYNESVPKVCIDQANCVTSPIGNNGCLLRIRLNKGKKYVFVGGMNANDYGIFEGYVDIQYDPNDELKPLTHLMFWSIFEGIVFLLWIISLLLLIIIKKVRKNVISKKGENEYLKQNLIKSNHEVNIKTIIDN